MATPDVCPLDSRRGETEVFIKRIAVMITVLCLQGHLNSLRGIKGAQRLPMCIYLFIFNPVYPLLTLVFDIGWVICKAHTNARERYTPFSGCSTTVAGGKGPPEYYIAAAIGVHASHDEGITKTSTSLLRLPPSVTQAKKEEDVPQVIKRIGRLIVLAAVAVQCSATVLLGIRRELHGAATPSDRRYYLFAVSGLAILAQTLIALFLSRSYIRTNTQNVEEYSVSIFIELLHYLGSWWLISYYADDFLINSSLPLLAILALNAFIWPYATFFDEFDWLSWQELRDDPKEVILGIFMFLVLGLLLPLTCAAMSICYFVWISYNPYSDHFTDWSGAPVPTDVPCPQLWQDPLANTLWAF
jgi:hypothetical protein